MRLNLVTEQVQNTIRKNTVTSYGLTMVVGLPFPSEICRGIRDVQEQMEAVLPRRFAWYREEQLHATLIAPLRGRYRDLPPLQPDELPADIERFTQELGICFAHSQPFPFELVGVRIGSDGLVVVSEKTLTRQLASVLIRHSRLDQPKYLRSLHVAIGFLNTIQPFATDEEWARLETTLAKLNDVPIGQAVIDRVWLVHYANRTLSQIVGQVSFALGQPNPLTAENLLRGLAVQNYPE